MRYIEELKKISENVTKIAENEPRVYNAGVEDGKEAVWNAFWDGYQDMGNRTNYRNAFAGMGWTPHNFKPKYDIRPTSDGAYMMFYYAQNMQGDLAQMLEDCGVELDLSQCTAWIQYLIAGSKITRLGRCDCSNASTLGSTFSGTPLHTIDELIVSAKTTFSGAFNECPELQNLKISGTIGQNGLNLQWSTKLSRASIESVINALSTTTSGLTVTFSKTAKEAAFTNYEWASRIATKSNWTIALV